MSIIGPRETYDYRELTLWKCWVYLINKKIDSSVKRQKRVIHQYEGYLVPGYCVYSWAKEAEGHEVEYLR